MRTWMAMSCLLLGGCTGDAGSVPDQPYAVVPLLPGQMAPRFETLDAQGEDFVFDPANMTRPAVAIFYRGGWCPKCTLYWRDLRAIEDELLALDLDVIFLSADSADVLANAVAGQTDELGYHLLSDASCDIAQAFGIAFRVDDETYARYRDKGVVDLEEASGYTHHRLPAPAVYIIDEKGVIKFSYVNPDYSVRLHPDVLLTAAKTMPTYKLERPEKN